MTGNGVVQIYDKGLGDGLLGADWGEDREQAVTALAAAYAKVQNERLDNFQFWNRATRVVIDAIQARCTARGLTAPPWDLDALWARVDRPMAAADPGEHVALVAALLTDYQARFQEHIRYRLQNAGNVHLEITGPTGMGKSSIAISIADWIKTIEPSRLVDCLVFDPSELPRKLSRLGPWDTAILDEYLQVAGEGARTLQAHFENVEDTLRASQINLIRLSPRRHEGATMQATLEVVLENRDRGFSVCLVWLQGHPHGLVAIPWAPQHLWDRYCPWKADNVARSVSGQFKDNAFLAKLAVQVCADQAFVDYMTEATNKPKKFDFVAGLEFFLPQMLALGQVEKLASFLYTVCYNYQRLGSRFEQWFGVKPNPGLEAVALKCYKE